MNTGDCQKRLGQFVVHDILVHLLCNKVDQAEAKFGRREAVQFDDLSGEQFDLQQIGCHLHPLTAQTAEDDVERASAIDFGDLFREHRSIWRPGHERMMVQLGLRVDARSVLDQLQEIDVDLLTVTLNEINRVVTAFDGTIGQIDQTNKIVALVLLGEPIEFGQRMQVPTRPPVVWQLVPRLEDLVILRHSVLLISLQNSVHVHTTETERVQPDKILVEWRVLQDWNHKTLFECLNVRVWSGVAEIQD